MSMVKFILREIRKA